MLCIICKGLAGIRNQVCSNDAGSGCAKAKSPEIQIVEVEWVTTLITLLFECLF